MFLRLIFWFRRLIVLVLLCIAFRRRPTIFSLYFLCITSMEATGSLGVYATGSVLWSDEGTITFTFFEIRNSSRQCVAKFLNSFSSDIFLYLHTFSTWYDDIFSDETKAMMVRDITRSFSIHSESWCLTFPQSLACCQLMLSFMLRLCEKSSKISWFRAASYCHANDVI